MLGGVGGRRRRKRVGVTGRGTVDPNLMNHKIIKRLTSIFTAACREVNNWVYGKNIYIKTKIHVCAPREAVTFTIKI